MAPHRIALFLALVLSASWGVSGQISSTYTCPPDYIAAMTSYNQPVRCVPSPCSGNPGRCGAGGTCTVRENSFSGATVLESVCQCAAPAVLSHIIYADFCYVSGTNRCNPSPCKNGGTCTAQTDFNGVQGAFFCTCPSSFEGPTCELPTPAPEPQPIGTPPTTPPPTPPPVTGDQGQCGKGNVVDFPVRCYFNNDPQGRYVCCDSMGCNGFNPPNYFIPHCAGNGATLPNNGVAPPPSPPSGDQGVCGSGAATDFPVRCWYNNDPQGRYVCCDKEGCDGFNQPGNFFPHCRANGYVPAL